jgi:hypothetical protein
MRIDPFGNASSTEYCTGYCQYNNLWKHQNVVIANSKIPGSLLGLSTEETTECHYYEKQYRISKFQKLLIDGRIKVLKTCQSCRLGNNQSYKWHYLEINVNHRTVNNNLNHADPNIHLAATEQVQNPFTYIP